MGEYFLSLWHTWIIAILCPVKQDTAVPDITALSVVVKPLFVTYARDTLSRILYKKLVQVDLYKKLDCVSFFLVQVFSCTRTLHQIEQSSIWREKLADTWPKLRDVIGRLVCRLSTYDLISTVPSQVRYRSALVPKCPYICRGTYCNYGDKTAAAAAAAAYAALVRALRK